MRPQKLIEFKGTSNQNTIERLRIAISSAKKNGTILPHILLYGSAGLGKTTLANIVANEMDAKLIVRTGGSIAMQKDLFSVLYEIDTIQSAGKDVVLFFDEIHKLSVRGMPEEMFYSLLEDFVFYSSLAGQRLMLNGTSGVVQSNILKTARPFTMIGATTSAGMLKKPLRDRFPIACKMELYSIPDLIEVIKSHMACNTQGIKIYSAAAELLATCARGTPRVVINLLRSCCDRATYQSSNMVTRDIVRAELSMQGIESDGLNEVDLNVLRALADIPKGVGARTLASICSIDAITMEEMVLPFLLMKKFIKVVNKHFITKYGLQRLNRREQ